jgi:hypothetical protein
MSDEINKYYTPTCLEWIALELNVTYGVKFKDVNQDGFVLSVTARNSESVLIINVKHFERHNSDYMHRYIRTVKDSAEALVGYHKLNSNVEFDIEEVTKMSFLVD